MYRSSFRTFPLSNMLSSFSLEGGGGVRGKGVVNRDARFSRIISQGAIPGV